MWFRRIFIAILCSYAEKSALTNFMLQIRHAVIKIIRYKRHSPYHFPIIISGLNNDVLQIKLQPHPHLYQIATGKLRAQI